MTPETPIAGAPAVPPIPRAAPPPRAARAVTDALREQGERFGFFQAVRLLSQLHPERTAPGRWSDPSEELLRFTAPASLSFPTAEIASLDLPSDDAPGTLAVRFFGLTGPQGTLPLVYTDHVARRTRARDHAMQAFLDILHHRMIGFFYRAWEQGEPTVAQELGRPDRLRDHLLDLAGLGTPGLHGRHVLPDDRLAAYAGLLGLRTRPASGLAAVIGDYFGVRATVQQFVGEWVRLRTDGQCRLGDDGDDGRLGLGVVGREVWHPTARVRLRLGPLPRAQFDAFLPGGRDHEALRDLAMLYADAQVGVEAQLILAREDVPRPRLGDASTPALGRGTWLRVRPMRRDPDDTIVALD